MTLSKATGAGRSSRPRQAGKPGSVSKSESASPYSFTFESDNSAHYSADSFQPLQLQSEKPLKPRPSSKTVSMSKPRYCRILGAGTFGEVLGCDNIDRLAQELDVDPREIQLVGVVVRSPYDRVYLQTALLEQSVVKIPKKKQDAQNVLDLIGECTTNRDILIRCASYVNSGTEAVRAFVERYTAFQFSDHPQFGLTLVSHFEHGSRQFPVYRQATSDVQHFISEMTPFMLLDMIMSVLKMLTVFQTPKKNLSSMPVLGVNLLHHYDIKPANILVFREPRGGTRFVLADFGGATQENPLVIVSTYLSPWVEHYSHSARPTTTRAYKALRAEYLEEFTEHDKRAWIKNDLFTLGVTINLCMQGMKHDSKYQLMRADMSAYTRDLIHVKSPEPIFTLKAATSRCGELLHTLQHLGASLRLGNAASQTNKSRGQRVRGARTVRSR